MEINRTCSRNHYYTSLIEHPYKACKSYILQQVVFLFLFQNFIEIVINTAVQVKQFIYAMYYLVKSMISASVSSAVMLQWLLVRQHHHLVQNPNTTTLSIHTQRKGCTYVLLLTTIVVHSRDDKEVGMAHKVKSPENQPQFSQTTMGQYWSGIKLSPNKLSDDRPEMLATVF